MHNLSEYKLLHLKSTDNPMLECLHLLTFENKTMNVYVSECDYLVIQIKILRKSRGMPSPDFIILDQA